jgi:hypothetical protein
MSFSRQYPPCIARGPTPPQPVEFIADIPLGDSLLDEIE